MFLQLQFEAFYTVNLLNAKWKVARAYLRGGGFRGFKPPKFSDFFLKSEGKEIERKKGMLGGGGVTS